jgi:outer membrane PBP1 activator LpoA protein
MRKTVIRVALTAALLAGCSKSPKPVVATPELEAAQKDAEELVKRAESAHQKSETSYRLTGAEQEAIRFEKMNGTAKR